MKPAIVVVGYNRPNSIMRTLEFLANAHYEEGDIALIISIDYQDSSAHGKVIELANKFKWNHGSKKIIEHTTNLGLRKHVLSCGNLVANYDSIIMLEDDIAVSPYFYTYAKRALEYFEGEPKVAGISLYKHAWNVCANRPFEAVCNGYDTFLMQFAQSWGQCWSRSMWEQFSNWLETHLLSSSELLYKLPKSVREWPETSWLKYAILYLIDTDKFFVYPQISLSTNFSEVGTHNKIVNNSFQVALASENVVTSFATFENSVKYDSSFERIGFGRIFDIEESEMTIDLYGSKADFGKRYLLTSARLPYKTVKSFGLRLRPHELNIIFNVPGDFFYLYDTIENSSIPSERTENQIGVLLYDYKEVKLTDLFRLLKYSVQKVLIGKIRSYI